MKHVYLRTVLCATVAGLALALPSLATAAQPSAFSAGQKAPSFEAKTTDGKTVKFPSDYKGKVVLLDFWATWCPPCRAEMPNVSAAYQKLHEKGFEILGISLDKAGAGQTLADFTKSNNMPWAQVYDGQYWKAALAEKYGIHSIPRPILVDGDTGIIIAEGPDARGSKLVPAAEKALADKKK